MTCSATDTLAYNNVLFTHTTKIQKESRNTNETDSQLYIIYNTNHKKHKLKRAVLRNEKKANEKPNFLKKA